MKTLTYKPIAQTGYRPLYVVKGKQLSGMQMFATEEKLIAFLDSFATEITKQFVIDYYAPNGENYRVTIEDE